MNEREREQVTKKHNGFVRQGLCVCVVLSCRGLWRGWLEEGGSGSRTGPLACPFKKGPRAFKMNIFTRSGTQHFVVHKTAGPFWCTTSAECLSCLYICLFSTQDNVGAFQGHRLSQPASLLKERTNAPSHHDAARSSLLFTLSLILLTHHSLSLIGHTTNLQCALDRLHHAARVALDDEVHALLFLNYLNLCVSRHRCVRSPRKCEQLFDGETRSGVGERVCETGNTSKQATNPPPLTDLQGVGVFINCG